ncbi:transient receptor potential cation channel subfamily A member 1-like [Haliotis rubra]|uniref:transient receptor potential cation channel subfamily A member 1-like n=1 Tax=Haliotis rubra TaxID=36100 RepID=UPI001EE4EE24|nr:transient receptor potential cation channel subfamily A member 1-like [Haliotis rubra]
MVKGINRWLESWRRSEIPSIPDDERRDSIASVRLSLTELAGQGDLEEFELVYRRDPSQLNVKDAKGKAPVHHASARGRTNILQSIVKHGGDLNLKDHHGNTPLHYAVEASQVEGIEFLLDAGADSNVLNDKNMAALHVAADGGYLKSLEALVKHKDVNVNLRGEMGGTPLHFCANMNTGECARLLLEAGALPNMKCDNGFYPIHAAAKSASADTLSVLIQAAIKRGYKRDEILSFLDKENNTPLHSAVHSGEDDGSTPIHFACSQGNLPMVYLMDEMQPDNFIDALSVRDIDDMTPLHRAAIFNHFSVVEFLMEKGADMNVKDTQAKTPLLLAASKGGWETVTCLLGNKADMHVKDHQNRNFFTSCNQGMQQYLNEKDDFGCTPLHYASKEGHLLAIDDLLKMGAVISPKNNEKRSPFHFAARNGRLSTCRRLLDSDQGASIINETDTHGQTGLHMAAERGHTKVVKLLLQKGAMAGRDFDGNTALHLAASSGYTHCMRLLLGVYPHLLDFSNNDDDTPLHLSALHGHTSAVTLLMSMGASFTQNVDERTFFDNAIQHASADVAMGIVIHKRWQEAMDMTSPLYGCPMVGLIRQLPEVCMVVLERCQSLSSLDPRSRNYFIDFNFKYLRSAIKPLLDKTQGGAPLQPMPELNMMVKTGRVECLSHPVCVNFLRMKWNYYGRWYCSVYLLIYLTFLAFLTTFVVSHDSLDHFDEGKVDNATIKVLHGNHLGGHYFSPVFTVLLWLIEVFAALNILKEIFQMITERWRYFTDCQNVLEWLLYVLTLVFVSPFLAHYSTHWQWEVGAFAVFLAWFNCLVFLQRFDFFGIYVVMFVEILKTLLQVIVVFSILVIAFGLAFYILMSHEKSHAYSTPGLAMLRSVTMMLEMEYMDTYNEPYNDNSVVTLHYAHGTLFFMTIFVLFMPIILMNLLIGLAVGDIQSVLTNARLQRLTLQVNLHSDIERKMPRELLVKLDKETYRVYPNRRRTFLQNCFGLSVEGLMAMLVSLQMWSKVMSYDNEFNGMDEGRTAAHNQYVYTELNKQKNRLKELSGTMERNHDLLRQIARGMDIHSEEDARDEGLASADSLQSLLFPDGQSLEWSSTSLGRVMLQQSMVVARWKRFAGRGRGGGRRGRGGRR